MNQVRYRRGDVLYKVPIPTHTRLARSACAWWARAASRRRGEGVTSQHLGETWSRRALRAACVTGWPSCVWGAPRSCAKGAERLFWWFRAAMATSLGRIATLRGTRRPGLDGPRCARLASILGLSGAVEHAGGASRVSIADPSRSRFRALRLSMRAPERSALRPNRVLETEARSPPT